MGERPLKLFGQPFARLGAERCVFGGFDVLI
jgi:hypothetical protein